jgi:hypothetical protein
MKSRKQKSENFKSRNQNNSPEKDSIGPGERDRELAEIQED